MKPSETGRLLLGNGATPCPFTSLFVVEARLRFAQRRAVREPCVVVRSKGRGVVS
ncbi:MAG: hypothetical protein LBD24_01580 [Spirochaetaceae bacterium]|nr:hypothetical protein [Spirochaetaceae bacterium]